MNVLSPRPNGLLPISLVMAEVNAEVKARSLSNQFGLHLSTAESNNEGGKEDKDGDGNLRES